MRRFLRPGCFPALALAACLVATAAPADWPHDRSDLPPDPAVTWGRLENGIRYAILPNAEPRERVSVHLVVMAGSLHETDAQQGLAHFIEHMGFNGTKHFPPGQLIEYFQRLGMAFGPDTNASTGFERTAYQVELPKNDRASIEEALLALRDYADGNLFLPEEIESERGVILAEKRDRDSVEFRAFKDEFAFLLPETLVPRRLPIGTEEVLRTAPREQFTAFYDAWYRPDRMYLAVVGPVVPAEIVPLLAARFGDLQPRGPAQPEPDRGRVVPAQGIRTRLHRDAELARTTIAIQTVEPRPPEIDRAAVRLAELPRALAYAMLNRRFSELAKREGAPFNNATAHSSDFLNFVRNSSVDIVAAKPELWPQALAVAEQELRRALEHGFQPAELQEVVANFRNGLDDAVKKAPTRRSPGLAAELIQSLVDDEVFTHPAAERDLLAPALDRVTVEDCVAALRRAWPGEGRYVHVSGNLDLPDAERAIAAAYAASRATPVEPPAAVAQAAWAYSDFGAPGAVARRSEQPDLGLIQVEFANGVRLNLKRTDFQADTILASARIGGGLLTLPAAKPGLNLFTGAVASTMGLGRHSSDELRRVLAGRTVGASLAVGEDAFVVAGSTTPRDLELQLQLMAAVVTDPGYRPEAERLVRRSLEQAYKRMQHTPEGLYALEIQRALADGDPRIGYPAREVLAGYTMADVRAWLEPELARAPIELGLVGDLDVEQAIALAARTFGALPPRAAKPAYAGSRLLRFPAAGDARTRSVPTEIPRGMLIVAWPTDDAFDAARARRLRMLAAVIDDRLRLRIREGLGGAYSPSAGANSSETFPGYGYILVHIGVDPAQAPAILQAVRDIAESLRRDGVNDDELQRAKQPTLTQIAESVRTNGYWLNAVAGSAQEFPQRLDWARTRAQDVAAITAAELTALAARHLHANRELSYIVLPDQPAASPAPPATAPAH